jgi:hypothetical protein
VLRFAHAAISVAWLSLPGLASPFGSRQFSFLCHNSLLRMKARDEKQVASRRGNDLSGISLATLYLKILATIHVEKIPTL